MKRYLTGALAAVLVLGIAPATVSVADGSCTIGVSNTVQGNGRREEMICAIIA